MSTGLLVSAAGTRTGAMSRWIRVAVPSAATSYTLPKNTRSVGEACDSPKCAAGMPTLTTSLLNGGDVKSTCCPGCSVGGSGFCGLDCGPGKFAVSGYAGGTPRGGSPTGAEGALAPGVAGASLPDSVILVVPAIGKAGASPACSSSAPLP